MIEPYFRRVASATVAAILTLLGFGSCSPDYFPVEYGGPPEAYRDSVGTTDPPRQDALEQPADPANSQNNDDEKY